MANKQLFQSVIDLVTNRAGGAAYALSAEAALAQYAVTGTFNGVFYADAGEDFARVKMLTKDVSAQFLAQCAVYAHEAGRMRDVPAFLVAVLLDRDAELFGKAFDRVIGNLRMVRTFVQIVRSAQAGRKSLGSLAKRKVGQRLLAASDRELINAVGQDPAIGDVIKLSRPKPQDPAREALFGYFIGKQVAAENLPEILTELSVFRADATANIPAVDFRLLTSSDLSPEHWKAIAYDAPWLMTVKNLNTFLRHGVFADERLVDRIAQRVANRKLIAKARAFPYQLFAAYSNAYATLPMVVREALIEAAEIATDNVPSFDGRVAVFPDVSGSMRSPVTGYRKGASSNVRCVDVAALVTACVLRKNPRALVLPFETEVVNVKLTARDSIMTNAEKLAAVGGGGTNCSAPLAQLNRDRVEVDVVIYVSDNESWVDPSRRGATATQNEFAQLKKRVPGAKLVAIDLVPNATAQARSAADVLNVGGFGDNVFELIAQFLNGGLDAEGLVGAIKQVKL